MIKINNKEYRNLEEQVQFNSDRIENIYETSEILGKLGIKVVGNVDTPEELPARETYPGEFGDAILVGTEPPYDYYIWTRPFDGEEYGEWFNIGQFPLPGPQGATGAKGDTGAPGERGNAWFTGEGTPTFTSDVIIGDLYLDTLNNKVYRYTGPENKWLYTTTVKGDPGIQGEPGEPGPAGPIVDIIGTLTNIEQLPSVEQAVELYGRQVAYLIGTSGSTKSVWGLVGPDDNLSWANLGLFAAGTIVYFAGTPRETINLDDWMKKITPPAVSNRYVYTTRTDSSTGVTAVELRKVTANTFDTDTFPWRDGNGTIKVPTPQSGWNGNSAANKDYVDTAVSRYHGKQVLTYTDRTSNWTYFLRTNMSFKIALEFPIDGDSGRARIGTLTLPDGIVYLAGETYAAENNGIGVFYEYKLNDGTTSIGNHIYTAQNSTMGIVDLNGPANITAVIANI